MIPIKFLKMVGIIKPKTVQQSYVEQRGEFEESSRMMEEELQSGLEELAVEHVDTEKYGRGVNNMETLSRAIEHHEKVRLEQMKLELQIAEAQRRRNINWDVVIPKLGGCAAAIIITIFWLCLEQGTPLSMRMVSAVTSLTMPKL